MPFFTIDVGGHSGCSINIIERDRQLLLSKSCIDAGYAPRLIKQADKQQKFFEAGFERVQTPLIHSVEQHGNTCTVIMDYIHSLNFVEFLDTAGFEKIERFSQQLVQFIEWEIQRSEMLKLPEATVTDKFSDVAGKIAEVYHDNEEILLLLARSEPVFAGSGELCIPVGQCHGDLTLSNIIFNHDRIFLVDFLDSFIESPLIDMVKLRQDTALGWSYLMYGKNYDKVRHQITMQWFDQVLEHHFMQYGWYVKYYSDFQLLNLLRILQYAKEPGVTAFLKTSISKILDHHGL